MYVDEPPKDGNIPDFNISKINICPFRACQRSFRLFHGNFSKDIHLRNRLLCFTQHDHTGHAGFKICPLFKVGSSFDKFKLSDEENISYEMNVNKKNYDALFYQVPDKEKVDTLALEERIRKELLNKYTKEELANPSEETTKGVNDISIKIGIEMLMMKPVWFRICEESLGKYYITMYYDNEYNHANGEDL